MVVNIGCLHEKLNKTRHLGVHHKCHPLDGRLTMFLSVRGVDSICTTRIRKSFLGSHFSSQIEARCPVQYSSHPNVLKNLRRSYYESDDGLKKTRFGAQKKNTAKYSKQGTVSIETVLSR